MVGGSEAHARIVAERLARTHEVTVATTTALDYWTWDAHYPSGTSELNGVTVRRFPIKTARSEDYKAVEARLLGERTLREEWDWLRAQGPHCPELLDHLHREGHRYGAVLFYTYIYEPTALGVPLVPERAALIPTAHDEVPLRLAPFRAAFHLPRAIGYLTPEERALAHRTFRNEHVPDDVLGIGLDPPPERDAAAFRRERGLQGRVVLYLGQVSEGKGCDELLAMWAAHRGSGGEGTLVLAGTPRMEIPARDDVVALGRVEEREKWSALEAADVLVLPSHLESLGIVLLEAWQVGTAVLVPEWNQVSAGQVRRSGGGLTYSDAAAFSAALATLFAEGPERGESGRAWVERECAWEAFDRRVEHLVQMARFDD